MERDAQRREGDPAGRAPLSDPASKTVLVVEDDAAMRDLLQSFLWGEGFDVALAFDGLEAMERLASGGVDLVVLDIMLPGTSGLEVLAELRRQVPVVVVTGKYTRPEQEQEIRAMPNVVEYLKKPIHHKEFIELVHRTLGTQRRQGPPS